MRAAHELIAAWGRRTLSVGKVDDSRKTGRKWFSYCIGKVDRTCRVATSHCAWGERRRGAPAAGGVVTPPVTWHGIHHQDLRRCVLCALLIEPINECWAGANVKQTPRTSRLSFYSIYSMLIPHPPPLYILYTPTHPLRCLVFSFPRRPVTSIYSSLSRLLVSLFTFAPHCAWPIDSPFIFLNAMSFPNYKMRIFLYLYIYSPYTLFYILFTLFILYIKCVFIFLFIHAMFMFNFWCVKNSNECF